MGVVDDLDCRDTTRPDLRLIENTEPERGECDVYDLAQQK
jgi:hypothetical protein